MAVFCPNCAREFEDQAVPEFCPTCGAKVEAPEAYYTTGDFEEGREPGFYCPFEDTQRPFFERFMETSKQVAMSPSDFYRKLPTSGGLGHALLFAVIYGFIGGLFAGTYSMLGNIFFGSTSNQMVSEAFGGMPIETMTAEEAILQGVLTIALSPALAVIGVLIGGLIIHGVLALLGGTTAGLEATIKVYGYAQVSAIGQVIPICGAYLLVPIWAIVLYIIGLAEVHQCSTGKAVLAVLLPIALCCLCLLAVFGTIFGVTFTQLSNM